ncbi:hypothetical protein [Paracoccus sp. 228]|uniref:hypothetical protein n=1 Tax=Paracoccus sp. 228 TaxID=1192054 RepID=UPI0005E01332|nr:hypothetical protein [Paracoccus sp. 228]KIX16300.1 hypothetical protein SY26_18925 [Paracoccus sp. 228]
MKLEHYARRLAQKTGTPVLEDIILGKKSLKDLPETCMPWTGRKTAAEPRIRVKKLRDYNGRPYMQRSLDRPYGIITVEGRRLSVHRYVFMLLIKPNYAFTLWNQCGNTLCCNPSHWTIHGEIETPEDLPEGFYYDPDEPWTQREVNDLLDQALAKYIFYSWQELIENPLLEDCPHDMLMEGLTEFRRRELLP